MTIANSGISMYFCNGATVGTFPFMLVPAVLLRVRMKERTLFGIEKNAEFARKRKCLFPAIW
jgi:hypothetical protein